MGRDSFSKKEKLGLRCEVYILLMLFFFFFFKFNLWVCIIGSGFVFLFKTYLDLNSYDF